eukprot:403345098
MFTLENSQNLFSQSHVPTQEICDFVDLQIKSTHNKQSVMEKYIKRAQEVQMHQDQENQCFGSPSHSAHQKVHQSHVCSNVKLQIQDQAKSMMSNGDKEPLCFYDPNQTRADHENNMPQTDRCEIISNQGNSPSKENLNYTIRHSQVQMMGQSINSSFHTSGGKESLGLRDKKDSPSKSPFQQTDQNRQHLYNQNITSSPSPLQYVSVKQHQNQITSFNDHQSPSGAYLSYQSQPQKSLQQSPLRSHAFQLINQDIDELEDDNSSIVSGQKEIEQFQNTLNLRQSIHEHQQQIQRDVQNNFENQTMNSEGFEIYNEYTIGNFDSAPQPLATLPMPENHAIRFMEISVDQQNQNFHDYSSVQIQSEEQSRNQTVEKKDIQVYQTCDDSIPRVQYSQSKANNSKRSSPIQAQKIQNYFTNLGQKSTITHSEKPQVEKLTQKQVGHQLRDFINAKNQQLRGSSSLCSIDNSSQEITPRVLNYKMQQTSRQINQSSTQNLQNLKHAGLFSPESQRSQQSNIVNKKGSLKSKISASLKEFNLQVLVDFSKIKKPSKPTFIIGQLFSYLLCMINNHKVDPLVFQKDWVVILQLIGSNPSYTMHQINQIKERLGSQDINNQFLDQINLLAKEHKQLLQQITDKNSKILLNLVQSVSDFYNQNQGDTQNNDEILSSGCESKIYSNDTTPRRQIVQVQTGRSSIKQQEQSDFAMNNQKHLQQNMSQAQLRNNRSPQNANILMGKQKHSVLSPQGVNSQIVKNKFISELEKNQQKLEEFNKRASFYSKNNQGQDQRQNDKTPIRQNYKSSQSMIKRDTSQVCNGKKTQELTQLNQKSKIIDSLKKQIVQQLQPTNSVQAYNQKSARKDLSVAKCQSQSQLQFNRSPRQNCNNFSTISQAKSPAKQLLNNIKSQYTTANSCTKQYQERSSLPVQHNFKPQISEQKLSKNIEFKSPVSAQNLETQQKQKVFKRYMQNPFSSRDTKSSLAKIQSPKKTFTSNIQYETYNSTKSSEVNQLEVNYYKTENNSQVKANYEEPSEINKILKKDMFEMIIQKAHEIEKNMRNDHSQSRVDHGMIEEIKRRRLEQRMQEQQEC